jgi:hypothetical protein
MTDATLTAAKTALLHALNNIGSYVMPEQTLFAELNLRLSEPLTLTDFRQLLQESEEKRRIASVNTEDGRKWKITDNGRGRLAELV